MRALLGQLAPVPGDPIANARRVVAALDEHPDAEIALFPEMFLGGYAPGSAGSLACEPDAAPLREIATTAERRGTAVIVGFAERVGARAVANAAACIAADGSLSGVYRKAHLFGEAERQAFDAGDDLYVVSLAGHRVGPLICFDIEFPEPARALAEAGAELLVSIAANMRPYYDDHELASRARALDNRIPHVYVNRVGREAGLEFVGGSRVVDAAGRIVAEASNGEQLLVADVELPASVRDGDLSYLQHVRGRLPVVDASNQLTHGRGSR